MQHYRMHILFSVACCFAGSTIAKASTMAGTVSEVLVDNSGGPYAFYLNGSRTTPPACATDTAWVITTPGGDNAKAMFAAILTASVIGRTVNVAGTGTCPSVAPTRDSVSYISSP
jgi:hypothetical protein